MPPALPDRARAAVLTWFDASGRILAFRATRDPYAVLVSEVMAQQTQVSRVVPAWERFLARFPTIADLAAASPADVLREWRGMGYDRRALNLHRAVRMIVAEHGGRVPSDVAALERLPGIGPYTARAVAAIAFGMPVAAVDTNVRRVLGRALGGHGGMSAVELQDAADASVDRARPGEWTHALMDIGATLCRPTQPRCEACPLRAWCRRGKAAASDDASTAERPSRAARPRQRGAADRARPVPFTSTTRWLRGRLLDRLRETPGEAWTAIGGPIGEHDAEAIDRALAALARDGIIEVDAVDRRRARLATA